MYAACPLEWMFVHHKLLEKDLSKQGNRDFSAFELAPFELGNSKDQEFGLHVGKKPHTIA